MRKQSFIFSVVCLVFLALLMMVPLAAMAQSSSTINSSLVSDSNLSGATLNHNGDGNDDHGMNTDEGEEDDSSDDDDGEGPGNGFVMPKPTGLTVTGDFTSAPLALTFTWQHSSDVQPEARWFQVVVIYTDFRLAANKWVKANKLCTETECNVGFDDLFEYDFPNGDYKWYVRAWGRNSFSDWSDPGEFTINVLEPEIPDGFTVTIHEGRPSIMVPNNHKASWYQVYVGHNDEDDHSLAHMQWYKKNRRICTATTCELFLDFHPTNGKYVAYVLAWGPGGFSRGGKFSGWAGPIEFEINFAPPDDVVPMTPTWGDGHGPHFGWHGAHHATWYNVWIGTADFTQTLHFAWHPALDLECNDAGECTLDFGSDFEFEEGQTYVWYIKAWGPGGFGHGGEDGWIRGNRFKVIGGAFVPQPDSD